MGKPHILVMKGVKVIIILILGLGVRDKIHKVDIT